MPDYINGLAVDASLVDALMADDTSGLAIDSAQGISVDGGYYGVTPIFSVLTSGSEPFLSGSDEFVTADSPFNIGVSKNLNIYPKTLRIGGPANELVLDSLGTTLYVGSGYTFALSLEESYPIRTTKIVPVTSSQYTSSPSSILGISKIIGVKPTGIYNSRIEPTNLAVDQIGTTFSFGDSLLSINEFNIFDPVIHKSVNVRTGNFDLNQFYVEIKTKGRVILDPLIFDIDPYPVGIQKTNVFNINTGVYDIRSFAVSTKKYSTYVEGKYIKDSANFYQLYVDQGIDYSILIETQDIGIEDNTSYTFNGKFAKHQTSVNKYDIRCTKITPYLLRLDISGEDTSSLTGRFNFDIIGIRNNISTVIMTGAVIIKEMVLE